jgi:hypothetical protein
VNSVRCVWNDEELNKDQPRMKTATEWLQKRSKQKIIPTEDVFFQWSGLGTMGRGPDSSIIVEDEDGVYILANDYAEDLSSDIMADVVRAMGTNRHEEKSAKEFWKVQLHKADQETEGIAVEVMSLVPRPPKDPQSNNMKLQVNTMHKRKAQKVQPVDDSGQKPREIEGRIDWKERAKEKQMPNVDSDTAPFGQHFEPRYASFPRGTRVTPQRLKDMKISPDLLPNERLMLEEMLYRREGALAWDFSESGRVSREVIPPVVIDTVPHQAWRADQFPIPRKLREVVMEMVQERIDRGTLELCKSQYRNP